MAHGYRHLHQWNHWLTQQGLGKSLLKAEEKILKDLLQNFYGKHALLIGVPNQYDFLHATHIPCHSSISPIFPHDKQMGQIESDFQELPILTGSIDLVLLPHTLEFVDNPQQLLAEACRVIKPEGLIVITGFNPMSAWGLQKILKRHHGTPWAGNFIQSSKIKQWLRLADFELETQRRTLFTPPITHPGLYQKCDFLERIGRVCFPALGGVYALVARAKVVPLTPIRLKWTQKLSGLRISTSISGHIVRQSKQ